jgi:hypothetical protein
VRATDALGWVYTVHPSNAECYFLRLLLHAVRGPTSFASLKTIDRETCETFREACQKHGLLENDQHWDTTMSEASMSCFPAQLRGLFAIILTTCGPSNPKALWEKYKENLSEDILREARGANTNVDYCPEIFNRALILLQDKCISINGKTVSELGLEAPTRSDFRELDRDILQERNYNIDELQRFVDNNKPLLVDDQRLAYNRIMESVERGNGGLFFLDAPGGTGKTFLINLLLAEIRKRREIALAIASSGIAATLLEGGKTAHSALKLPLDIARTETPVCNITRNSGRGEVLKACKLIVWDECSMAHKRSLEALDRTLQDIRGNNRTMGGTVIVLAGDFRQTLPVIPRSTPADELNACLKASYLWRHVQKLTLTTNMRVHLVGDTTAQTFANQLLTLGNGEIPTDPTTDTITFPPGFCQAVSSVQKVVENVFPEIVNNYKNHTWLCERAILAPTNDSVNHINTQIQNKLPGTTTYKSINTVIDPD